MKQFFTILLVSLLGLSFTPVLAGSGGNGSGVAGSVAGHEQNAVLDAPYPNPASNQAYIKYELPGTHFTGELRIYSLIGQEVKVIPLEQAFGEAEILTADLKSGIYFVYMVVDGKKLTSRKMIVSH